MIATTFPSKLNTGLNTISSTITGNYIDATWYRKSDICRIKFAGAIKLNISANVTVTLFQLPFEITFYKMIPLGPDVIGFLLAERGKVDLLSYGNLMGGATWIYMDETFII